MPKIISVDIEALRNEYEAGMDFKTLVSRYKIKPNTLKSRIRRESWDRSKRPANPSDSRRVLTLIPGEKKTLGSATTKAVKAKTGQPADETISTLEALQCWKKAKKRVDKSLEARLKLVDQATEKLGKELLSMDLEPGNIKDFAQLLRAINDSGSVTTKLSGAIRLQNADLFSIASRHEAIKNGSEITDSQMADVEGLFL